MSRPLDADPFGVLGDAGADETAAALSALSALVSGLRADGAPRGAQARPGDVCAECACPLVVQDMSYECLICHAVYEAADIHDVLPVSAPEVVGAGALRGRLRIVGREAGWYQPDLDRTNPGESTEAQKKSTYAELVRYNREYEERGGNPFPLNILETVASSYNVVQQHCVKRSQAKKAILAALVFHACIAEGFTRQRPEVAELLQLPNHGIARGDDFLRSIDEDRGLEIDINCDRLGPHITSAFVQLDLESRAYDGAREALRAAVTRIVRAAEENHIGVRSNLRSKVIAAIWEVLRRTRPPLPFTIDDVSGRCSIRKHTIKRFLEELGKFHSRFEKIYGECGLDASPPDT